jgi:hypothetical protein
MLDVFKNGLRWMPIGIVRICNHKMVHKPFEGHCEPIKITYQFGKE